MFLNELRFQKNTTLSLRMALKNTDVVAVKVVSGQEGMVEGVDYRGVPVIASLRKVADSPWFLVARMDAAEALAPAYESLRLTIALVGALLLASAGSVGFSWQKQRLRNYRDRVHAAAQLASSKARHRAVTQSADDAIITADARGGIIAWNPAAERIFGYTEADALGQTLDALMPERYRDKHRSGMARLAGGGESHVLFKTVELHGLTREGRQFPMQLALSQWESAGVVYFTGIVSDISQRKLAEDATRQANEQLRQLTLQLNRVHEAESILVSRELHDEFGQMLTRLKMDLSLIAARLGEGNPELRQKVVCSMTLVEESMHSVQSIAARLRPRILDELGLLSALDWLVQDFRERSGIDAEFMANAQIDRLMPEQATAVFRIVQESLCNVVRHADAKRIDVSLDLQDGWLVVEIRDDGKGLRENEKTSHASIGLLGMRERALAVGGELSLRSVLGKGTVVTLRLPLSQGRA